MKLTLADVCNIVIQKVQNRLGVLNNSGGIRGQKVLDLLRETILTQERAGLAASELRDRERIQSGGGSFEIARD